MRIEQAIYGCQDVGGYRFLAQSPGFHPDWLAAAERLCTGFGERPAGVCCPLAVFAQPLDGRHVAVVQAADQGWDDAGRPGALAFRLLVLTKKLYNDLEGDLFRIAEALPPSWQARGELPALEWAAGPPPVRGVAGVRRILDVDKDRTALLLGGAQVLVDGGRVVVRRSEPDPELARQLWDLLPASTRVETWPTSFAFGNRHGFHLAIVPESAADDFARYVPESAAGDYPEGRYEAALLHAAETDDQAELDGLFSRQSRRQRFKMVLLLLGLFALIPVALRIPTGDREPEKPRENIPREQPAIRAKPEKAMSLPAEAPLPAKDPQRRELRDRLNRLARPLGVEQELGLADAHLVALIARLDKAIDAKMADKAPARRPADLATIKEPRTCLRTLLWKHGVAEYADTPQNVAELIDRLEGKLVAAKLLPGEGHE